MRSCPDRSLWVLLAAGLLAGAGAAGAPSAEAAVVVLANRTKQPVSFSIHPSGGQGRDVTLPPGRLIPVPLADRVEVTLGTGKAQRRVPVDPNCLYYFVREGDQISLQRAVFAKADGAPWMRVDLSGKIPPPVVVAVKLLADEEEPAVRRVWEQDLRQQIEAASRIFQEHCRVRFEVVGVGTWESGNRLKDFGQLSDEFRRQVSPDPARLAIGVTSQYRISSPRNVPRTAVQPLCSHLLLPAAQERFPRSDQLTLLVRELGHFLGAAAVADDHSVMGLKFPRGIEKLRQQGLGFDPVNALVMNLLCEEIRTRDPRSLGEVPQGTRKHLQAIYTQMARDRSSEAARYALLVAAPDGQRGPIRVAGARARPPAGARHRNVDRRLAVNARRRPAVARAGRPTREPTGTPARYTGMWADGTRQTADGLESWHETSSQPRLAGRPLFDQGRPIRWLVDNTLCQADPPAAAVEMIGGDVLPGRVIAVRSGVESEALRMPPHFLVAPHVSLDRPYGPAREHFRVPMRWVRRVVWQRATDRYQPGTLIYRDGRRLAFRSLRPGEGGIRVLLSEGVRLVPLEELAELHLPRSDPWEAYFDALAVLAPDGRARLVQWETEDGLRVTGSAERFQARARGSPSDPKNWYHMVQPAWCLEPLWVAHRRIRLRCYFMPQEVPLSRIDPGAQRQQSDLGGAWPGQVDRNVEGGPLAGGDRRYHWGLGVHALSELEFPLPSCARSLRTRLGLDTLAGDGGCVLASIFLGPTTGKPLYASPAVIGSTNVLDTGPLRLEMPPGKAERLVLRVDPAHGQRPRGADPLDIRDHFDWLEPLVELDPEGLRAEIARRAPGMVPAWRDWTVSVGRLNGPLLVNHWDEGRSQRGSAYRLLVNTRGAPLALSRKLWVSPQGDRLLLTVTRPPDTTPSTIEVQVDGRPAGQFDVPRGRPGSWPEPMEIPLAEHHERHVTVQLRQHSEDDRSLVQWWAITLAGSPAPAAEAGAGQ